MCSMPALSLSLSSLYFKFNCHFSTHALSRTSTTSARLDAARRYRTRRTVHSQTVRVLKHESVKHKRTAQNETRHA
jgi:hypothetical protein